MNARALALIRKLELQPHPEGGFYRETFRSARQVDSGGRPARSALTTIYFLLAAGSFSAWHRVLSDEVWHWHEGAPLELMLVPADLGSVQRRCLAPVADGIEPVVTVPADWWQAARPLGEYALCSCTVAPGFQFEDFSFLRDDAGACAALQRLAPELASLL
jgi:predicted cupin superfamily sugar epimerase